MSYKILVDSDDPASSSQDASGTSSHWHKHKTINSLNMITVIFRALCCRRLRMLKFYAAILVIMFLLFFFLAPDTSSTTTLAELEQSYSNMESSSDKTSDNKLNDNSVQLSGRSQPPDSNPLGSGVSRVQDQFHQIRPIFNDQYKMSSDKTIYSHPSSPQSYYVKNFTYALSLKDFYQMKNINTMQTRIQEAAKHSWDSYKRYAWAYDMLKPRSKEPDHWFHLGLTIVDSTDTLIIMGLAPEVNTAIDWMENDLKFQTPSENSNCFELTIRILGGLLTVAHLSGRERLKQQAIKFGDILLHCYDTESKIIPYSDIDLNTHKAHPPAWNPHSSLAEVASLQLEFRYLTHMTGNPIYEDTTFKTSVHIHNLTLNRASKLLPMYINPATGQLEESAITLGARADSYYEYLLKQYLQTGIKWLEDDYLDCMDEVQQRLVQHTNGPMNYTYIATMQVYRTINDTLDLRYTHKMDHLVCFLPGTLVLGYYHFSPQANDHRLKYNLETPSNKLNSRYDSHLDLAKALARTCYHMYSKMGTGLAPEIASFVHSQTDDPLVENQPELQVQSGDAHNVLRPEYVESIFYLYHITGLSIYRDEARKIFEAFQTYSRIPSGFSAISDVRHKPAANVNLDEALHQHAPDRMESFWLSETLKYLYLTFCDDRQLVGNLLNYYVFNTEGHMLPIV